MGWKADFLIGQEIRSLQKRNTQLENQLEQVTSDLKRSTTKIKSLQNQIANIIKEGEENARELMETRAAMKQVKIQLTRLFEQQSASDTKKTEAQLAKSFQDIQRLEKNLNTVIKEKKKLEEEIKKLEKKRSGDDAEKLRNELERAQTELEQQRQQFRANLALLHDREQKLQEAQATIQKLNVQAFSRQTTDERVAELESALSEANRKLLEFARAKSQLEAQLANQPDPQSRFDAKDAEIKRLEDELRKAAEYINARNREIADILKEKEDLSDQSKDLQQSSIDSKLRLAESEKKMAGLSREAEQLKSQLTTLQSSLNEATRENEKLRADLMVVEQNLARQASVPDAAKKRIQELTLELQETRMQIDKQQQIQLEYPKLQQETDDLREQIAALSKEQQRANSLQKKLRETQLVLEQAHKELKAVATVNLEVKTELQDKENLYQFQNQKFKKISDRNAELEKRYKEAMEKVTLKEQVLQQVATEKSILEKVIDEEGSPFDALKAKLQHAEEQNALLHEQLRKLNASQILSKQKQQQEAGSKITLLQRQFLEEKTLRERAERNLQEARKQVQMLRQQATSPGTPPMKDSAMITPVRIQPPDAIYRETTTSIRALFPQKISQRTSGKAITILGWSPNKTKLAYQETTSRFERLWILDAQTQQSNPIMEWQRRSTTENTFSQFAWAFDNSHFLFAIGYPKRYELYVGNGSRLGASPIYLQDQTIHFAWAPAQLQFAYFSGSNLVVQSVQGETLPLQLGQEPGAVGTSLAWSPDGTRIVFSSKRGANFDIFVLLLANAKPLLQTLVSSSSDDIQPSWSPNGQHIAFYVRSDRYDTKLAIIPVDRSRSPYVIAHKVSLPSVGGPVWLTATEILYVGEEYLSASQNSLYRIDITTGQRSSAPMSVVLSN